ISKPVYNSTANIFGNFNHNKGLYKIGSQSKLKLKGNPPSKTDKMTNFALYKGSLVKNRYNKGDPPIKIYYSAFDIDNRSNNHLIKMSRINTTFSKLKKPNSPNPIKLL